MENDTQPITSLKDFLLKGKKKDSIARQSRRSSTFLKNKINNFQKQTKKNQVSRPTIGNMYLFHYSAKHDDKLPYWDRFPLILHLGTKKGLKGGFAGLNLHYIPPRKRAIVLDKLIAVSKLRTLSERSKLKISYDIVKAATKFYKATYKNYLYTQMRSKFIKIPATEWHEVVSLPLANFKGASKSRVYKDSNLK